MVAPILGRDGTRVLFDRAAGFFKAGQYARALAAFERLRHYPGMDAQLTDSIRSTCLFNLGATNRRLHRFSTAIIYFETYLTATNISVRDRADGQRGLDESKWRAGIAP